MTLTNNLHKFFNKCDIPWVQLVWDTQYNGDPIPINSRNESFWWKDIFKLIGKYKNMASVIIEDDSTCLFWSYLWHGPPLNAQYLELFSFSKMNHASTKNKSDFFYLPLSVKAFDQYQTLLTDLESIHLGHNNDSWKYS
jgi:hypothetical protein